MQVPVMRGMYEIEPLMDLCDELGGMIIGGYARYCCSTAEHVVRAGDVDIFPIQTGSKTSDEIFMDWSRRMVVTNKLEVRHENEVSLTLKIPETPPFNRCPTIQIIKPMLDGAIVTKGTVEEVLGNFDFTVVRVALNKDRKTATAWASFLHDENAHLLRILNIHCPISSLIRTMKYGRKGYYMRPAEAMKLFVDWEQRPPSYKEKIVNLFSKGSFGEISKEEIDELEALLHVD